MLVYDRLDLILIHLSKRKKIKNTKLDSNGVGPYLSRGAFRQRRDFIAYGKERIGSSQSTWSALYSEWLIGPFRPVVRTSSFHVEDTGSIPVRDRQSFSDAFRFPIDQIFFLIVKRERESHFPYYDLCLLSIR